LAFFNRTRNYQFKKYLNPNPENVQDFFTNTMNSETLQSIAFRWLEAFNNKEIEKLLSFYDEEAKHYSPKLKIHQPETNGYIEGKQALKLWWEDAFHRLPTLFYKVTSLTANGDRVFMEYIRKVENESELLVAEVLEVKNGKIISSRVYHG
jgi:limonene-1,2-epoxide hydrolase